MKQLKIVLIVVMSVIMFSICAIIGIGISTGTRFWNCFGVKGSVKVGDIDVGRIDTGNINVGRIDTGNSDAGTDWLFAWNRNYALVLEKEVPAGDIRSLKIDYSMTFNDVIFYQGTGEDIIVREYMNFSPEDRQLSTVKQNGTELEVKGARNFFSFLFIGSRDAYTEIYLPAHLAGNLENVSVKTVSGSVLSQIPLSQTGAFTVSTTSGDVFFPEVRAKETNASSTGGDIRLASVTAETVDISTTSGDIILDQARGKAVISSTSGTLRLGAQVGELRANTTSGDISLGQVEGDAIVSTTSGDISLGQVEGDTNVSSTSGDISLGQVEGDMTVSTTSGAVRLEKGRGNLDAESSSGDIRADSLDGAFQMSTTSGTLSVLEGSGLGRASSVSGDIRILLADLRGDLDISTTSGDVSLRLPETASFSLRFGSTSGECGTFFDDVLSFNKKGTKAEGRYGGGENAVDVSTVSGDLTITKY